jgi:hypothetical protein
MQVGECLHHPLIGLLELLRAFRFCSAIASARRQSAATEQLSGERCEHLSQMIEMPDEGRAVRPAMSRIQSIARSNFAGRHRALISSFHISRTTAYCSLQCAPATLAAMRNELFAPRPTPAVMTEPTLYSRSTRSAPFPRTRERTTGTRRTGCKPCSLNSCSQIRLCRIAPVFVRAQGRVYHRQRLCVQASVAERPVALPPA